MIGRMSSWRRAGYDSARDSARIGTWGRYGAAFGEAAATTTSVTPSLKTKQGLSMLLVVTSVNFE